MTTTTGRNRANVMTGTPELDKLGGYFFVGKSLRDAEKFPKNQKEDADAIKERFSMESGGFISKDGIKLHIEASKEKVYDFHGDLVASPESEFAGTIQAKFLESTNATVLKLLFGEENVEITEESIHVRHRGRDEETTSSILFDLKGKGGNRRRVFADEVVADKVGEITYTKSGLIEYDATLDLYKDVTDSAAHEWIGPKGETAPVPDSEAS